jgi:hypothetical protein
MFRLIVMRFDIHLKVVWRNLSTHESITYVKDIVPSTWLYYILLAEGMIHVSALTRIIFKSSNKKEINRKTA